jgi:hypothetical protein
MAMGNEPLKKASLETMLRVISTERLDKPELAERVINQITELEEDLFSEGAMDLKLMKQCIKQGRLALNDIATLIFP